MKFRTEVFPEIHTHGIKYSDQVLFMGSCFSEHIHQKMELAKFNVRSNPYGIVYNPLSLANQIEEITTLKKYTEKDLHFENERWFSYHHHSDFSFESAKKCLSKINNNLQETHLELKNTSHFFITLGTAWTYTLNETGATVSNCHKIPAKNFTKTMASADEMVNALSKAIASVQELNSEIQIIFSVSPVRHLGDGSFENQLSKGRLFEVIYQCQQKFKNVSYFNAYELILDDLRDYRYFGEDLIHPSSQAISYVWEKFQNAFLSLSTLEQLFKIEKLVQAANHRPFNKNSEAHQKFVRKSIQTMQHIEGELNISFQDELLKIQKD